MYMYMCIYNYVWTNLLFRNQASCVRTRTHACARMCACVRVCVCLVSTTEHHDGHHTKKKNQ